MNDNQLNTGRNTALVLECATEIAAAYVGNNPLSAGDVPKLIRDIFETLSGIEQNSVVSEKEELKPAVSIKKSINDDYLICLEDGKKFKSLKRHLRAKYDMSPDEYRAKWGLPADYPMVSPNYAKERSRLAKKMKLGQVR